MAGGALSFREDPFRLTPDRRYIFETDGFRRAFAMLLAGVRARRGAMLLTGPSGTGKTTLLQGLLAKLQQDGAVAFWRFHPDIPGYDLVGSCLAELEVKDAPADAAGRARALAAALKARAAAQPAVLIIDEAGQFADAQLAELGTLPAATNGTVQVVLAGLPGLVERLSKDALTGLGQAIALRAELGPLTRNELGAYIAHRCRVAGQAGPLVFEPAAIGRVFDHTGGTPRLVNRLCATSLFFAEPGSKQISAAVVDEAARACANEEAAPTRVDAPAAPAPAPEPTPTVDAAPPPAAPERPAQQESPSEVHRTLAEAERAWISGGTAPVAASSPVPAAVPTPAAPAATTDWQVAEAAAETGEDHAPTDFGAPSTPTVSEPAPARRRSPALRIAASVVVIAGAAATAGVFLWPSPASHEHVADTTTPAAPAVVSQAPAANAAPDIPVAASEPALPSAPVIAAIIPAAPVAAAAEPAPAPPPEPVVQTRAPEPVPVPVAAELPPAPRPRPVFQKPAPEPAPVVAAVEPAPAPLPELTGQKVEPEPAPIAAAPPAAPEPEPVPASTPAPEPPTAAVASVEPLPAEPTPPTLTTSLSAIEPANGQTPESTPAAEQPAAPTAAAPIKIEPEPLVVAMQAPANPPATPTPAAVVATTPTVVTPAPTPPAVAAIVPTEPAPAVQRVSQAALPMDAALAAELQRMMVRGDEMLRLGDPASARLFYERAAARGLARGYTAVGQTYDPTILQRLGIRGGGANGEQALAWYRRGADAGDGDATRAISELSTWLARPR